MAAVFQKRGGHSGFAISSGGTVNFIPWHSVGEVSYNDAATSITVYLNFTVAGQGNNAAYLAFDITDPIEVSTFLEMLNVAETSYGGPFTVTPV